MPYAKKRRSYAKKTGGYSRRSGGRSRSSGRRAASAPRRAAPQTMRLEIVHVAAPQGVSVVDPTAASPAPKARKARA